MKILQLITARGGSKGVPGKNTIEIEGLPLVAYKILSAKASDYGQTIVASTDDHGIAEICKSYGAQVPFLRPEFLASDTASSFDVIRHALKWLEDNWGESFDIVSLLEPSSPFATYKHINEAVQMLQHGSFDAVVSVIPHKVNPIFIHPLEKNGGLGHFARAMERSDELRRQTFEDQYTLSGALYIFKVTSFMRTGRIVTENTKAIVMSEAYGLEIDTMDDLAYARYVVTSGRIDLSMWR